MEEVMKKNFPKFIPSLFLISKGIFLLDNSNGFSTGKYYQIKAKGAAMKFWLHFLMASLILVFSSVPLNAEDVQKLTDKSDRFSYSLGMEIGNSMKMYPITINADLLARGVKDTMSGGETLLTSEEAREIMHGDGLYTAEGMRKMMSGGGTMPTTEEVRKKMYSGAFMPTGEDMRKLMSSEELLGSAEVFRQMMRGDEHGLSAEELRKRLTSPMKDKAKEIKDQEAQMDKTNTTLAKGEISGPPFTDPKFAVIEEERNKSYTIYVPVGEVTILNPMLSSMTNTKKVGLDGELKVSKNRFKHDCLKKLEFFQKMGLIRYSKNQKPQGPVGAMMTMQGGDKYQVAITSKGSALSIGQTSDGEYLFKLGSMRIVKVVSDKVIRSQDGDEHLIMGIYKFIPTEIGRYVYSALKGFQLMDQYKFKAGVKKDIFTGNYIYLGMNWGYIGKSEWYK
jgi:hypothetical protein